jgi:DUF1680 family protein
MPFHRASRRLPISAVKITNPFWQRWQRVLAKTTLPQQYEELEKTGRLEHFRRVARGEEGGFEGFWFDDSDVYKWIEACAYSLIHFPSDANRNAMDEAVELIIAAQEPNGYLNTFFQLNYPEFKWKALFMGHEIYCGGHLIEAACAHSECTGSRDLLNVAIRWADNLMSVFGPGIKSGMCGHEESELALIKLSETTGESKYREYARWQMEQRGKKPSPFEAELELRKEHRLVTSSGLNLFYSHGDTYDGEYCQDHLPIRQQDKVVGHAVRAMYLYIAATQLAEGRNDPALETALASCWKSLTERRMYVTGGIGPSGKNEGFTLDYDLPNHSAYAETCAAIGLALWGHRLFEQTGESGYLDTMETALYNGALAGISLTGNRYFYVNPLESRSDHERSPWFSCACCPPNIARLIGQIGQLALGIGESSLWLNLPIGLEAETSLGKIRVESDYPWSGQVEVRSEAPVHLRVPSWCSEISVNGVVSKVADGRILLTAGSHAVDFEMKPQWLHAQPLVLDDLGRVALRQGPLIYCLESSEFALPQQFSVDLAAEPTVLSSPILEGIKLLRVKGKSDSEAGTELYSTKPSARRDVEANLIPYYAWNNRGKSHMQVWLRTE